MLYFVLLFQADNDQKAQGGRTPNKSGQLSSIKKGNNKSIFIIFKEKFLFLFKYKYDYKFNYIW